MRRSREYAECQSDDTGPQPPPGGPPLRPRHETLLEHVSAPSTYEMTGLSDVIMAFHRNREPVAWKLLPNPDVARDGLEPIAS